MALPAGFRVRDMATVAVGCPEPEFSGRLVEISTGQVDDETGTTMLGVWSEDLKEFIDLPATCLTRTGERLPPPARGRRAESAQVSGDGEYLGSARYVILDELDQYL